MKKFVFLAVLLLSIPIYLSFNAPGDPEPHGAVENVYETSVLSHFHVYGTHMNLKIDDESGELVLIGDDEIVYPLIKGDTLTLSKDINRGINLENIEIGEYELFLRKDGELYRLINKSDYESFSYYTLKSLRKIDVNLGNGITFSVYKSEDHEYDIVIDPGHGGRDPGAIIGNIYERDLNLDYSLTLKEELEKEGFRVAMTRNNNESIPTYGKDGRVSYAYNGAKFFFSIHFNSTAPPEKYNGVEIYVPNRTNTTFAGLLAESIKESANTNFSNNPKFSGNKGIYNRTFDNSEINSTQNSIKKIGESPYENLTTKTPYYFVLRETGGIMTNAYVDGRNPKYLENVYRDNNISAESLLIEFGYMNDENDLKNILNNKDGYIKGFVDGFVNYLD